MGFKERFPLPIPVLIALAQILLTAAIVGLEGGSIYYDLVHGTIWAGFWCGIIFIKTFLSMLCLICCGRGRCCATYCLVLNLMSGALACVLIYFDQLFINNVCQCYIGSQLCCYVTSISSFQSYSANSALSQAYNCTVSNPNTCRIVPTQKIPLLEAQLACAVGMLVTCGIYVVTWVFATFGICFGH